MRVKLALCVASNHSSASEKGPDGTPPICIKQLTDKDAVTVYPSCGCFL